MKKFFRNFILFLSVISIFIVSASPAFCVPTWDELTQAERNDYIEGSIEDIRSFSMPYLSKPFIKEQFGIETTRDPNYREHVDGKTSIPDATVHMNYSVYRAPGPHLMGSKGYEVNIISGYTIVKNGINIKFNKSGNILGAEVHSKKTSYGTYATQIYNKSLDLECTEYYDPPYIIIFDKNYKVEKIHERDHTYNIKGKRI